MSPGSRRIVRPVVRGLFVVYLVLLGLTVLTPGGDTGGAAIDWVTRALSAVGLPSSDDAVEKLLNVVLFLPLAGLGWLAVGRLGGRWRGVLAWTAVGFAVSGSVELMQRDIPGRYATWSDVATNTLGAFLGALLGWLTWTRRTG